MPKKKGEGRGLEAFEVALIKNLRRRGLPRDYIMSLITRPGRVVSPAAVDEVHKGRLGGDIEPSSDAEADLFVQKRLAEVRPISERDLGGPASQIRVNEVLRLATVDQGLFPSFEGRIVEFKAEVPPTRDQAILVVKTMAAYANTGGGYIVFGIQDDRTVAGLREPEKFADRCDLISNVLTSCFCPAIEWDKNIVEYQTQKLGIIYVYEARQKPIVAMRDNGPKLIKSAIYFRYEGKTERIEPGDLLSMIAEIRRSAATANETALAAPLGV